MFFTQDELLYFIAVYIGLHIYGTDRYFLNRLSNPVKPTEYFNGIANLALVCAMVDHSEMLKGTRVLKHVEEVVNQLDLELSRYKGHIH